MTTSSEPRLTDYKVLVFDVYGTLADWETGLFNALKPLLDKYPVSQKWSRKDALIAHASVEHDLEAQYPDMLYADLLARSSEVLEERLRAQSGDITSEGAISTLDGSATTAAAEASASAKPSTSNQPTTSDANPHVEFGKSVQHWPVFPDSCAALHELAKDYKLVVLSNVDHDSFRYTHTKLSLGVPAANGDELKIYTNPHLLSASTAVSTADQQQPLYAKYWHPQNTPNSRSPFSLILTAQDTKCYKPALGGFHTALECIRSDPALLGDLKLSEEIKSKVLIVAQSLEHDHEPAHRLGLTSVWIDRQGAVTCKDVPEGTKRWTWRFETLGKMAEAVAKEKSA